MMENNERVSPSTVQKKQQESSAWDNKGSGLSMESASSLQLKALQAAANESAQVQQYRALQMKVGGCDPAEIVNEAESTENKAGAKGGGSQLPGQLRTGIESMSGLSMADVQVHYNSELPGMVAAKAFARNNAIFLAPGEEAQLPHEAWHVVQQMQGRVKANTQAADGSPVNDDAALEDEADQMGAKAMHTKGTGENVKSQGTETKADQPAQKKAADSQASASGLQLKGGGKKGDKKRKKNEDADSESSDTEHEKKKKKDDSPIKNTKGKTNQKVVDLKGFSKLKEVNGRNAKKKGIPRNLRKSQLWQEEINYGFPSSKDQFEKIKERRDDDDLKYEDVFNPEINEKYTQIDFDGVKGYDRKGFGGQPFLYLDKEGFDDKMIKSNYDEIISFFKGKDAEIALQILGMIENGGEDFGTNKQGQAKSLMFLLTQFIEAHNTRIPGTDKLVRAFLRQIAMGQLTFHQVFNRKDGLFASAWAKAGKAPKGGQVGGRALFSIDRKKDNFDAEDLKETIGEDKIEIINETAERYLSEDSDHEDDELCEKYHKAFKNPESILDDVNETMDYLDIDVKFEKFTELSSLKHYEKDIEDKYFELLEESDNDELDEVVDSISPLLKFVSYESKSQKSLKNQREQALAKLNLIIKKVKAKGNCFYDSAADQLVQVDGSAPSAMTLRGLIAQLILNNPDHFKVYVTGNQLNQIVEQILTNNSWRNMGGDFAPQLIATVLNRNVIIVQPNGPITITPIQGLNLTNATYGSGGGALTITYDGIGHYDSTEPTKKDKVDEE